MDRHLKNIPVVRRMTLVNKLLTTWMLVGRIDDIIQHIKSERAQIIKLKARIAEMEAIRDQ